MTQSTSELAHSIALISVITTQSTSELAQLTEYVNDDDIKPAAKPAANTDNELSQSTIASSLAQSGTLDSVNAAQSAFSQARITDAISNELAFPTQVRQTKKVPSFICHSLCI
jgi:hypothetical protein